jgi:hypothetical protein
VGRTGCSGAGENDADRAADLDDLTGGGQSAGCPIESDVTVVSADYLRGLKDRLTAAAIIPMHTPDEAIAELEFVTKQLGSKVGMCDIDMTRRVAASLGASRACDLPFSRVGSARPANCSVT